MLKKIALTAAVVLAAGGSLTGAARAQGIDPINTRQTALDLLAGTFANVRGVVATKGDVKTLEGAGKAIQRFGALMPSLFPAGSDKGTTKAGPAIWSDAAGFQKAAMTLSGAGGKLAELAKAGDADGVAGQVKVIGDACGACHKDFRLK